MLLLNSNLKRVMLPVAVFIAVLGWKNYTPLVEPRFWAEEGPEYFAALRGGSTWEAVTYVFRGNYQFLTNVTAYAASFAPIEQAPFVTTYAGVLAAILVCLLVCLLVLQQGGSVIVASLAAAALALIPMGYEVYASATNLQWVCAGTVFLLFFVDAGPNKWALLGLALWVAMCALTGVPSAMLAPAMWLMWFIRRDRARAVFAAILSVGLAMQVFIIMSADHGGRLMTTDPTVLVLPTLLQGVAGMFLAPSATAALGTSALASPTSAAALIAAVVSFCTCLVAASRAPRLAILVLGLGFGVGVLQTFAALGNPRDFVGGGIGARYYFTTAVAMILVMSLARRPAFMLVIPVFCLAAVARVEDWSLFTYGPSWDEQIEACSGACDLAVWPRGYQTTIPFSGP